MIFSLPIRRYLLTCLLLAVTISVDAAVSPATDPDHDYLTRYAKKKFAPLLFSLTRDNLPPDVVRRTETLLIERELNLALAKKTTGKQGRDLVEHLQQLRVSTAAALQRELGPALTARIEEYVRTLPQRQLVNDINQLLAYENAPMAAAQVDALCALIASQEPFSPEEASRVDRSLLASRKRAAYSIVIQKAASFLDARQLQAVENELSLQVAYLATSLGR